MLRDEKKKALRQELTPQEQESEGILQSPAYHKRKPQRSDEHESGQRSEERFSRNAETDLVCRLLLEKKKKKKRDEKLKKKQKRIRKTKSTQTAVRYEDRHW